MFTNSLLSITDRLHITEKKIVLPFRGKKKKVRKVEFGGKKKIDAHIYDLRIFFFFLNSKIYMIIYQ